MNKTVLIIIIAILLKLSYFIMAQSLEISIFKMNDSYWYEKIALNGQQKITPDQLGKCEDGIIEQSYYAFFPLYPYIIRGIILTTGLGFNETAFILSFVLSITLFIIFYKFSKKILKSENIAFYSTLFLILLPFHYYFSVFYTEALFLVLLILSFYMILIKKRILLIFFSSLLVLSRPNGILMLIPLFLFYIENNFSYKIWELFKIIFNNFKKLSFLFIPLFVFLLYCVYLYYMTGSFFAFKKAQAGWCGEIVFPWIPIIQASNWIDFLRLSILSFYLFVQIWFIKKIPLSFNILILIGLLFPLVASSITSPRFISVLFVFPFIFAFQLNKIKNNYYKFLFFSILIILHLFSFQFWIQGSEMSY